MQINGNNFNSPIVDHSGYLTEGTLTGSTHVALSATTLVVEGATGIQYPNGVQRTVTFDIANGLFTSKVWTKTPSISSVGNANSYASSNVDITPSGSTPASTDHSTVVWTIPDNWVSGTSITFDYAMGCSTTPATNTTEYLDINMTAVTHSMNPQDDVQAYIGREYSDSRWTGITFTMAIYEQTFTRINGMTLTSDGTMNADMFPGDQVVMTWHNKQSEVTSPGCQSSTGHIAFLKIHYTAHDMQEDN